MKKKYSILLSEEIMSIVKEKAKIFNLPIYAILESMIMEFSPSTPKEKAYIKTIYYEQRNKFIRENPNATPNEIFRAGYHWGWKLFQIRKSTSMYEKYKRKLK